MKLWGFHLVKIVGWSTILLMLGLKLIHVSERGPRWRWCYFCRFLLLYRNNWSHPRQCHSPAAIKSTPGSPSFIIITSHRTVTFHCTCALQHPYSVMHNALRYAPLHHATCQLIPLWQVPLHFAGSEERSYAPEECIKGRDKWLHFPAFDSCFWYTNP